jgi:Ser/Thr protein kinase RdoA (MazF antagonist)
MQKLDAVNQVIVSHDIIAKMLLQYGINDFHFEIISGGIENTSLLITNHNKQYVLRIYRRYNKSDSRIAVELQFQDVLREHGLPIPHILTNSIGSKLTKVTIDGFDWQVILMEYMGKTDFKHYTSELINDMATIQATMHLLGIAFAKNQATHEHTLSELKETIAQQSKEEISDIKIRTFLDRGKKYIVALDPNLPYGYNHLDFDTYGNILVKNDRVTAILDFDDLSYSPSVVCLGYTLWEILFETNDTNKLEEYLKVYEEIRPLNEHERSLLPQIMLFRNYAIGAIIATVTKQEMYHDQLLTVEKRILANEILKYKQR